MSASSRTSNRTWLATKASQSDLDAAVADISTNAGTLTTQGDAINAIISLNGIQTTRLDAIESTAPTGRALRSELTTVNNDLTAAIAAEITNRQNLEANKVDPNATAIVALQTQDNQLAANIQTVENNLNTTNNTVAANKTALDTKDAELAQDITDVSGRVYDLEQHVEEIDHLTTEEKNKLMEIFHEEHKNWFTSQSQPNLTVIKDQDNILDLPNIVSGAHEAYSYDATNKCFSVARTGYYKVAADITSVYTGD